MNRWGRSWPAVKVYLKFLSFGEAMKILSSALSRFCGRLPQLQPRYLEAEILMTSGTLGLIINFKDGFRRFKKELNKADEY